MRKRNFNSEKANNLCSLFISKKFNFQIVTKISDLTAALRRITKLVNEGLQSNLKRNCCRIRDTTPRMTVKVRYNVSQSLHRKK